MGTKIIKAKIGPMIQQYSYEVAQDFYDEFMEEDKKNKKFFFDNKQLQKLFFDLPAYVEEKLIDSDVVSINNCRTDTYSSLSSFFSYRRSTHLGEANCGRNISIIVNSDIS
jgi:copper oxidase (laccase) domain-containing protein